MLTFLRPEKKYQLDFCAYFEVVRKCSKGGKTKKEGGRRGVDFI